jgi:hypothetical protein
MSDREAGVFYIVYNEDVEFGDVNYPDGFYKKVCISCYRDYGETLVGTYCHDLKMNYLESCAGVLDMAAEVQNRNNVALRWNSPSSEQPVSAYHVYRNDVLLKELPQTAYLDENLPNGDYTYSVRAVYADGCESLSYNTVKVTVQNTGIGEKEKNGDIVVFPNPTSGELHVTFTGNRHCGLDPQSPANNDGVAGETYRGTGRNDIEIFDVFGRTAGTYSYGLEIDISHLPSGMYFVRITTENGTVTRKVVKR